MITYELAKQLKDAGFRQDDSFRAPDCDCEDRQVFSEAYWKDKKYHEFAYAPTLSELIEACGNRFSSLVNTRVSGLNDNNILDWTAYDISLRDYMGNSPEEAVANLWLELNKK